MALTSKVYALYKDMKINLDVMAFGSMARPLLKDATVCPFGFGRRLKVAKIGQNYRIDK
jgi:hypothetical protein